MVTGHAEQILRVNLGSGRIEKEPVPDQDVLRKYVGGTGLALYYLIKECPPDASAQDSSTPIIFMTGPLGGTRAPSPSNSFGTACRSIPWGPTRCISIRRGSI